MIAIGDVVRIGDDHLRAYRVLAFVDWLSPGSHDARPMARVELVSGEAWVTTRMAEVSLLHLLDPEIGGDPCSAA